MARQQKNTLHTKQKGRKVQRTKEKKRKNGEILNFR